MKSFALAALLAAAPPSPAPSTAPVEWVNDDGDVLELLLAHRDDARVDGGTLRLDRVKRVLTWKGAPNEIGCPRTLELAFADVKNVEADRSGPGFTLELRSGKPRTWTFMPLPHVGYLLQQPKVSEGGLQHQADNAGISGPDGGPLRLGGDAASGGPRVRQVDLPAEVERDVKRAVDLLRAALQPAG